MRDYVHVMDLAEGHLAALRALERLQTGTVLTLNLGTGTGHSVMEVARIFERWQLTLGPRPPISS